jgi:hypothetical protein
LRASNAARLHFSDRVDAAAIDCMASPPASRLAIDGGRRMHSEETLRDDGVSGQFGRMDEAASRTTLIGLIGLGFRPSNPRSACQR